MVWKGDAVFENCLVKQGLNQDTVTPPQLILVSLTWTSYLCRPLSTT
jgi:hypothetical protein